MPILRNLLLLCLLLLCLACGFVPVAARAQDQVPAQPSIQPPTQPPTTLTVVSDDNYPPYVFRHADGRVDGYLVDWWALWQRKTGVKVDLAATDWAQATQRMAAGQADVIDTIFRTDARSRVMDFTAPYADLPVAIFVHRDIGGIINTDSLQGFLVAAKAGDACIERLHAAGIVNIREYPSYQHMVVAAANDTAPIFCMDEPPAAHLLHRAGADSRFRKAFVLYTGQLHRAVRKGDSATLALLQRGANAMQDDELLALQNKWMGTPIGPQDSGRWQWLLAGLAAVAVLAALALGWGLALRRAVAHRTAQLQEQRQRLRTLLDTLPDMVWLKGLDGRYLACNKPFEQLVGMAAAQIIGRQDSDILAPQQATAFAASDAAVVASGQDHTSADWLQFKTQRVFGLYQTVKTPMRDAQGRTVGVLGIARDVTQQHAAQDRLQRLNRLYRVLLAVAQHLGTTREPKALLDAVCHILTQEGGPRMAWIGALGPDGDRVLPLAQAGVGPVDLAALQISVLDNPQGQCPTGVAYREQRTASANNLADDPALRPWHAAALVHQFRASAAFPIRDRGVVVAVLSVYSDVVNFFDAEELQLLERLADQLGIALEASEADAARSRAEDQLRASEARATAVFRASPVAMTLARPECGSMVDVNEAWLSLFGLLRQAAIDKTGADLGLWIEPAQRQQVTQTLHHGGMVSGLDARMQRVDGQALDVAFSAAPVEIAGQHFVLTSYVDISLRRQHERTLRDHANQLERRVALRTAEFNSIFQALPDLYFRIARDGTVLDYRAGRQSDLYSAPAQFLGQRMQAVLPPGVADALDRAMADAAVGGVPTELHYSLTLPTGQASFEARVVALDTGDFVVVVRNISERMAYEQARENALTEARELSRLRSEFLANMSHEIRTPLNAIMGLAQVGWATSTVPATRDAFTRVLQAAQLQLAIINDILDFSKIDANRLEMESVPVDLRALADSALDVVRETALTKGLRLHVQVAPDVPAGCLTDPLRLRQILLNLLTNAIKFTEHGEVAVRVDVEVLMDAGLATQQLHLQVADTGLGMQPAQLARLFEPFQQADSSTTRRYGGTGLGLSISQRLAQLMGGALQVQSVWGQGSRFTLRLPLRVAALPVAGPSSAGRWTGEQQRLRGLHILVAEDNPVNQVVLESALTMEGATVDVVENGQLALDRVLADIARPTRLIDLVLMDLQMPVMGGLEAAQLILAQVPDLPVIGQTADALPDEKALCLAVGMVAHLAKPVDLELLINTVLPQVLRRRS